MTGSDASAVSGCCVGGGGISVAELDCVNNVPGVLTGALSVVLADKLSSWGGLLLLLLLAEGEVCCS